MSPKIGWSLVLITGFLLMMITFSNPNPSQEIPVVVMETELKTEKIEPASSSDGASIETTTVPTESIVEEDTPSDITENVSRSSPDILSYDERENNAILMRERRKEGVLQYREYNRLRREWRKELSAARRDARESSDYTYYNELKSNPPDKNAILLGF